MINKIRLTWKFVSPALMWGVLAGGLVGCNQPVADHQNSAKASPAAPATVSVVQPQRRALRRVVEQPGVVHAYEETQLYARVSGYVGKVHFDIGRKVHGPKCDSSGKEVEPGEVLAEISVPDMEEEAKQKKALVRQAEADVELAKKALAAAEAQIATTEASVVEAKALLERWESESKRITKLVESGTIDAQARDEAQNQFKSAGARVLSTEAAVRKTRADRDKAKADVGCQEARVAVAEAEARRFAALFGYATIRAPYDGMVTRKNVDTGDFVQPTSGKGDWLFTIARVDPVRVVVNVPEADAGLVREKAAVKLSIKAAQALPLEATVTRISWALEPGSRTLRAEVDLPNKDGRLRPGMYVYAHIVNEYPESLTLPVSAVMKQGDAMVCYRISEGKALRTPVQTGYGDGQYIEVQKWQKAVAPPVWEEFTGSESVASRAAGLSDGQSIQMGISGVGEKTTATR